MGRLKSIFLCLLIVTGSLGLALAGSAPAAHAQEPITATADATMQPEMPRRVLFTLEAESNAGNLTRARLYFQPTGSTVRTSEPVAFEPATSVSLEHEAQLQLNNIPPGTELEYFWELTDSEGNTIETTKQRIVALDPRFEWQTIEDEALAIHWYDGDSSWGQAMFDTGKDAIAQLEERLGATLDRQVRLVAYASKSDFRGAFPPQQEWVGGQAFSGLGVTVQIIASGDREWMETVLYHELSHLVFHQATEGAIARMPGWLDEGMAMYNEPHSRNSQQEVETAAQTGELLPFSHLQGNFGADRASATLAYAQSEMLVTYLLEDCGSDGFRQFITNMVEDLMDVDEALEAACGYDSQTLHNNWRQTLPNPPATGDSADTPPAAGAEEENSTETAPVATEQQEFPTTLVLFFLAAICFLGLLGLAMVGVIVRLLWSPANKS